MRRWWASSLHAVGNRNLPWPYEVRREETRESSINVSIGALEATRRLELVGPQVKGELLHHTIQCCTVPSVQSYRYSTARKLDRGVQFDSRVDASCRAGGRRNSRCSQGPRLPGT